ncbi:MAG: hypothetical protein ABL918_10140 [Chakrabartia sp.]
MTELRHPLPLPRDDRSEGWRRIRVGAIGVVAILVLIGLSSAMMSRITDQANVSAQVTGGGAVLAPPVPVEEPLAELGVAPGAPEVIPTTPPARRPAGQR